jgi:hypothetical protein
MKDSITITLPQIDTNVNSPQPVEVKVPDYLCITTTPVGCYLNHKGHNDCANFKLCPAWQKMAEKEAQR